MDDDFLSQLFKLKNLKLAEAILGEESRQLELLKFPKIKTKIRFLTERLSGAAAPWLNIHPLNMSHQELQESLNQNSAQSHKSTHNYK